MATSWTSSVVASIRAAAVAHRLFDYLEPALDATGEISSTHVSCSIKCSNEAPLPISNDVP
jgi:hypothetical protein